MSKRFQNWVMGWTSQEYKDGWTSTHKINKYGKSQDPQYEYGKKKTDSKMEKQTVPIYVDFWLNWG